MRSLPSRSTLALAIWLSWSLVVTDALARPLVRIDGDLEVVQIDDFATGTARVVYTLRSRATGRIVELTLPEHAPPLRTGMRLRVRGALDTASGTNRRMLTVSAEPGGLEVVSDTAAPAAVVGTRASIVIVVEFAQDGETVSCTDAAIEGKMFTADPSVDRLYQQASFGLLSWPRDTDGNGLSDVFRVSIDDAGNDCDTTTWRSKADAGATALGANLSLYQHRVYVLPNTVACSWAGLAVIGCSSTCWAMVATCDRGDVYAHELGHNLGMYHASFDTNADGAVDATCPWGAWSGGGEYCDDSDFMGISTNVWRQTNAPHKAQMGWVAAPDIVDVATSGTYSIAPLEVDPAATVLPLILRVTKPGGYYYVSYRRRLGYDTGMRIDYADRTNVHGGGGGNTLLNAFLGDGQAFQDATNGIVVTQVAHDASSAQVAVTLQCGNGVIDAGEQCDGANLGGATCGGCAGTPTCTTACQLSYTSCTNGVCDEGETCASCAQDCVGGAVCGNGVCETGDGESCVSCPADCAGVQSGNPANRYCCGNAGTNPVGCDAARCGPSCTVNPVSVCCGDGVCGGSETAIKCARDCSPSSGSTSSTSTTSAPTSTSATTSSSTSTSTSSTAAPSTSSSTSTSSTAAPTTSSATSSTSSSSSSSSSPSTTTSSSTSPSTSTSTSSTAAPTSSSTSSSSSSTTSTTTASSPTTSGPATSTTTTTLAGQVASACPTSPLTDCRDSPSQRSQLVLRATKGLRWNLKAGGVVEAGELTLASIPTAGLRLCVYDTASTPPLVALGVAGANDCGVKPCWRAVGPTAGLGLRYRNKAGSADGVTDVRLRTRRGELSAVVRARGTSLAMPSLGMGLPVKAQLVVGDPKSPVCWQSVFATALRNDATTVKVTQQP